MRSEFHKKAPLVFCSQIAVHKAAAVEVLSRNAHLASAAFFIVDIVFVSNDRDRTESAKRFAFQTLPASVEFLYLIADHALQIIVFGNVHRLDLHGIFKSIL